MNKCYNMCLEQTMTLYLSLAFAVDKKLLWMHLCFIAARYIVICYSYKSCHLHFAVQSNRNIIIIPYFYVSLVSIA